MIFYVFDIYVLPTHKNRKQRGKTYNLCLKIPVRKQCCDEEK